ncbi:hypothetical protein EVA_02072 [gut metagenome]|uniref:Uncharacterized protein n=1 Tax=gut metagenome TaxID=749906 RepID=J9H1Y2_9ZZZZ
MIGCAHHFLQNDGHLFLVDQVLCGSQIGFAVAIEHRSIDGFDGHAEE